MKNKIDEIKNRIETGKKLKESYVLIYPELFKNNAEIIQKLNSIKDDIDIWHKENIKLLNELFHSEYGSLEEEYQKVKDSHTRRVTQVLDFKKPNTNFIDPSLQYLKDILIRIV